MAKMLTAAQAAEKLGLTVHQVYRRLHRRQIPFVYGGRRGLQYLISEKDLQDYIAAGQPLKLPTKQHSRLTVAEVAALTGFTVETVRKMCRHGTFKFVQGHGPNGHLRISRRSVEAYLNDTYSDDVF